MPTKKPPFRKNLLAGTLEFIVRFWGHPEIASDYRIGEQISLARKVFQ